MLTEGQRVRVGGVAKRPELNRRHGFVVQYVEAKGRYAVRLEAPVGGAQDEVLSFHPRNLVAAAEGSNDEVEVVGSATRAERDLQGRATAIDLDSPSLARRAGQRTREAEVAEAEAVVPPAKSMRREGSSRRRSEGASSSEWDFAKEARTASGQAARERERHRAVGAEEEEMRRASVERSRREAEAARAARRRQVAAGRQDEARNVSTEAELGAADGAGVGAGAGTRDEALRRAAREEEDSLRQEAVRRSSVEAAKARQAALQARQGGSRAERQGGGEGSGCRRDSPTRTFDEAHTFDDARTFDDGSADGRSDPARSVDPERGVDPVGMERVDLDVPFQEKDLAKARGAAWDRERRVWYVPAGTDAGQFAEWIPPVRQYLHVPFADNEEARAMGAKFDKEVSLTAHA